MANTNKILAATTTCEPVNWARSLGKKWYLPALNELTELHSNYDKIFSGLPINKSVYHNTSTENSNGQNEFYIVILESGSNASLSKSFSYRSIAMKVL